MGERGLAAASGYCRTRAAQVYEGKRDGRLLGRARERERRARRDSFFAGVEIGIHRMSKILILSKNFRIRLVEVVVRTFCWLKFAISPKFAQKMTLSMLAEIL